MMITPVLSCCKEETRLEALLQLKNGEGSGNPLQYSCLENPVDRGAWWAAVHGVSQSQTRLKRLNMHAHIGEGNGNPLQYSCLENPRDGGAWWAAFYGVAQSGTRLKRLSSSSSSSSILQKGLRSKQNGLWFPFLADFLEFGAVRQWHDIKLSSIVIY